MIELMVGRKLPDSRRPLADFDRKIGRLEVVLR